jgi:endonuclease/exonuclease/phosphatase family metal-dependent hydrolase
MRTGSTVTGGAMPARYPQDHRPRDAISLASLNVAGLPSRLAPFLTRAAELGRWLEQSTVDVLNVQEVWTYRALARLRAQLPSFRYVAWQGAYLGPAGGLVTFSRLAIRETSYTSFRRARIGPGSVVFRARLAVNTRVQGVLVATLDDFAVANTHLTANRDGDWSVGNRYETLQASQLDILRRVVQPSGLVLLSGDFNVSSRSVLYPRIVDGWHDPFAAEDAPTFHADMLPPGRPSNRIDYLLVSDGYPVLDSGLMFTGRIGGRYLSDHIGLVARASLSPTAVPPPVPR